MGKKPKKAPTRSRSRDTKMTRSTRFRVAGSTAMMKAGAMKEKGPKGRRGFDLQRSKKKMGQSCEYLT
jgi:hypothetical protein